MLKMFLWLCALLFVGIGAVLVYAATLPSEFRVARTATIASTPEKIFPLINDLQSFNQWNPFAKQDPTMTITYSGPASGPGAADAWDSEGRGGKGSVQITDSAPLSRVTMALHMEKPMEGRNTVVFALRANGNATDVTWSMTGKYAYIAKVMGVIFNMDKMIGGEFETGLADLGALAQKS